MTRIWTGNVGRRAFLKGATAISGAAVASSLIGTRAFAVGEPVVLNHWSWLSASDGLQTSCKATTTRES